MTTNNPAAAQTVSSAKTAWVKPEITSFVDAVEAQAGTPGPGPDGGGTTNVS